MLRKLGTRALVVGAALGLVMALPGGANATDQKPQPSKPTDCPVVNTDDKGNETIEYVPEGTVIGLFHCTGSEWEFGWFPFDSASVGVAEDIVVDSTGTATARGFTIGSSRDRQDVSMDEIGRMLYSATGQRDSAGTALLVTDDGTELTAEQLEALLAGKDAGGVKPLVRVDDPPAEMTLGELADKAGTADPIQYVVASAALKIKVTVKFKCSLWPPACWIEITITW